MKKSLIVLACCLLVVVGCLTNKALDTALLPAAQQAWIGVQTDLDTGLADWPQQAALLPERTELDIAMMSGDRVALLGVDWTALEPVAVHGVQVRMLRGEIGENGATSLFTRLYLFRESLASLRGQPYLLLKPLPPADPSDPLDYANGPRTAVGAPRLSLP